MNPEDVQMINVHGWRVSYTPAQQEPVMPTETNEAIQRANRPQPEPLRDVPRMPATSYLKLGTKIFQVSEVGEEIDLDAELRAFYDDKLRQYSQSMVNALSSDLNQDFTRQLQRLEAAQTRSQVVIPPQHLNRGVIYNGQTRRVEPALPIIYHPTEVMGSYTLFEQFGFSSRNFTTGQQTATQIKITITSDLYLPALISFDAVGQKLWMHGIRGAHTMRGGNLCIGNSRYTDYARLNAIALGKQISIINLWSLARQQIDGYDGQFWPLTRLITPSAHVKTEIVENTQWEVS